MTEHANNLLYDLHALRQSVMLLEDRDRVLLTNRLNRFCDSLSVYLSDNSKSAHMILDNIGDLTMLSQSVLHDLEATRRERDYLQTLVD